MITVNAKDVISTLVDHLLPRGATGGLYLCLRVTLTNWKATRDEHGSLCPRRANSAAQEVSETRHLHFLFLRPTNYTRVWCHVGEHKVPTPEQWVMSADHDSEWRSDGLRCISETFFDMAKNLCLPKQAPIGLHCYANVQDIRNAAIQDAPVPEDRFAYQRKILSAQLGRRLRE